ncbi:MAG: hypothetical protein M1837_007372 [Sclerophora amabilis]|nr:MAG: hypothetical protein M1837_007372 [Sclerophora amabilis]
MQSIEAGAPVDPRPLVNEKSEPFHDGNSRASYLSTQLPLSLSTLCSDVKTLWLFTCSEHKTVVTPQTAFGIFSALSGPVLTTNPSPSLLTILGTRLPQALLWSWLNILVFTISNQRLPTSVVEDSVNKPWRPMPSGRLSVLQARRLLLITVPLVFVATLFLGGTRETVAAMVLTWMYNDLGGADESFVARNLINALGLMCYASGASAVACGFGLYSLTPAAYQWLGIIGTVIFTTLQVQDLRDQEGDRTRGRSTAPLDLGDGFARWTVAIPMMFWSFACPAFWGLGVYAYIAPAVLGSLVAVRALMLRGVESDELTWKLWSLWISSLYILPLCKDHSVIYRLTG